MRVVDLKFRTAAPEAAAIRDIRTLMAAQEAYRAANQGFYDGQLDCLAAPSLCIPSYPASAPTFLDSQLASMQSKLGYNRSFLGAGELTVIPAMSSPSSRTRYRYDATATMVGVFGARGFAGASDGRICVTADGSPVPPGPEPATLPAGCEELREDGAPEAARPPR